MTGGETATIRGSPPVPPPGWARLTDRILARVRARSIDDKLLSGAGTNSSPIVLVRRAQLLQRRYRAAVAAQLQVKAPEVLASAPLILTLADELEQAGNVSPRGVILADRLVTDGDSPVYGPDPIHHPPEETVESAVKQARAALHLG